MQCLLDYFYTNIDFQKVPLGFTFIFSGVGFLRSSLFLSLLVLLSLLTSLVTLGLSVFLS